MLYFKTSQYVPGKGDAWTYYECDAEKKVLRQLTHLPDSGELNRIPDPIVKRLVRPDLLQDAVESEFKQLWGED